MAKPLVFTQSVLCPALIPWHGQTERERLCECLVDWECAKIPMNSSEPYYREANWHQNNGWKWEIKSEPCPAWYPDVWWASYWVHVNQFDFILFLIDWSNRPVVCSCLSTNQLNSPALANIISPFRNVPHLLAFEPTVWLKQDTGVDKLPHTIDSSFGSDLLSDKYWVVWDAQNWERSPSPLA